MGLQLGAGAAVGAIAGAAIALAVNGELLRFAWAVLLGALGIRVVIMGWRGNPATTQ